MKFSAVVNLACFGLALAAPAAEPNLDLLSGILNTAECISVQAINLVLNQIPAPFVGPTPFCSSYLGITTVTSTTTKTATATSTSTKTVITGTNTMTAPAVTKSFSATATACQPIAKRGNSSPSCPPQLSPYLPAQISTACKCLCIPTPTSTVTVTTTTTSVVITTTKVAASTTVTPTVSVTSTTTANYCAPTTVCNNQGLQWAAYHDQAGDNPAYSNYSAFDPTVYKTAATEATGTTTTVGGFSGNGGSGVFYGTRLPATNLVLNHRGYIYAVQSGIYTFTISTVDDIAEVWIGSLAYSGWTRSNENFETTFAGTQPDTYTTTLVAGTWTPLRIIWANAQLDYNLQFTITAPDGTVILGSSTSSNEYIQQFSCDGIQAPKYAPFGSET